MNVLGVHWIYIFSQKTETRLYIFFIFFILVQYLPNIITYFSMAKYKKTKKNQVLSKSMAIKKINFKKNKNILVSYYLFYAWVF